MASSYRLGSPVPCSTEGKGSGFPRRHTWVQILALSLARCSLWKDGEPLEALVSPSIKIKLKTFTSKTCGRTKGNNLYKALSMMPCFGGLYIENGHYYFVDVMVMVSHFMISLLLSSAAQVVTRGYTDQHGFILS